MDWDTLNRKISTHAWTTEFRALSVEKMMEKFVRVCYNTSEQCVPPKARARKGTKSKIPRDRYNLMRRRRRINVQLRKTLSESRRNKLKTEARNIEKDLQKSYRNSREHSEEKAVGAIKSNSKFFFSYAKRFSSIKSSVGPLINAASQVVACPLKMAEMLVNQYSKVFSKPQKPMEDPSEVFPDSFNSGHPWIHDINF